MKKDAAPDPDLPAPILAWIRQRFDIEESLGQGGSGRVFAAIHRDLDRPVALKIILRDPSDRPTDAERARDEGLTQAKLSHPNLVQIFEMEHHDTFSLLVCERVDGENLETFLERSHPLPIPRAIEILADILRGLGEIHRCSIVHRDLKPGNILIDTTGRARITDFGLATGPGVSRKTGAGVILGTPEYMAPEQILGSRADPRTDLYAVGLIAYEMVTGVRPFTAASPAELMRKHLNEVPLPAFHHRSDAPTWLTELIGELMAKDADARPAGTDLVLKIVELRNLPQDPMDQTVQVKGSGTGSRRTSGRDEGAGGAGPLPSGSARTRAVPSGQSDLKPEGSRKPGDPAKRAKPRHGGDAHLGSPPRPRWRRRTRLAAATATLAAVVILVTSWLGRSRPAELLTLRIVARPRQIVMAAQLRRPGAVELRFHPRTGGAALTSAGGGSGSVTEVNRSLDTDLGSAGGRLEVISGEAGLVEVELPPLPRPAVPATFRRLVMEPASAPLDRWEALLQGVREDQAARPVGQRQGDRVSFAEAAVSDDWREVRLVELRCVTSLTSREPGGVPIPCELVLEPDAAVRLPGAMRGALAQDIERTWTARGGKTPLSWREVAEIARLPVAPDPVGTGERLFAGATLAHLSAEERRATYQWAASCVVALVGAIDGKRLEEVPVEALTAPWVRLQDDPAPENLHVPEEKLIAYLPPELTVEGSGGGLDTTGIESLNTVGTMLGLIGPFINENNGILSPPQGCPPVLYSLKDMERWVRQADIPRPPGLWPPTGDTLVFECFAHNLERQQLLILSITDAEGGVLEIPLFNRTGTYNIPHPGPGLEKAWSVHSWKNLRWTTRSLRLEISTRLLPAAAPVQIRLGYGRNELAHDQRGAPSAVMGYRWITAVPE